MIVAMIAQLRGHHGPPLQLSLEVFLEKGRQRAVDYPRGGEIAAHRIDCYAHASGCRVVGFRLQISGFGASGSGLCLLRVAGGLTGAEA